MSRIADRWLTSDRTQLVLGVLEEAGHRAYAVGGCVRDALLRRPVADIDIATDARPEEVMAIADAAGIEAVPTGIDHGTVTLVVSGRPFEVTTFRRDVETDGRRAIVDFSRELAHDASRRDLTMNALYADRHGDVIDPTGSGLRDLERGRVRFIGDATDRIREDYLRILRFFRFFAWYGHPEDGMDPEALAAIAANAEGLSRLSRERIGHEMMRLLAAPDPAPAVSAMQAAGVLHRVIAGADATHLAPLVHAEGRLGIGPDRVARLAALGGEDAGPSLRLSKADDRRLVRLREGATSDWRAGELGYRLGEEDALSALALRSAFLGTEPDPDDDASARSGARQVFPLRAADLMPAVTGAALGRRLGELERRWIASGFALSRDELLDLP